MITNFFIPELNNHDVQELWFQQDGATCHTARATIDLLKDTFGDRLISRFGPVNWSPRSCDLTPLDYFLWGYVNIAACVGRDPMSVSRIWNRWVQDGTTELKDLKDSLSLAAEAQYSQMNTGSAYSVKMVASVFGGSVHLSLSYWPITLRYENVCSMVAERLSRHHTLVTMIDELWHRVKTAWASVPEHTIQSLFDSMPRRISAVITARCSCS
ncbi:uncharacterized protein TNCV_4318011 [Trichonephila clavipes]|nr:uncharacterized protein TNCV_4318011 [Trichonephila clavipes]